MLAETLAVTSAAFGGLAQSAAKRGVQHLSPSTFLAIKWGTSGLIFTTAMLLSGGWRDFPLDRGTIAMVMAAFVGPVLAWSMYTRSLLLLDVAVAFTISQLNLLWAVLLAMIFLGERPSLFTGLGAIVIIAGAALVQPRRDASRPPFMSTIESREGELANGPGVRRGVLLALGTSLAWGINSVLFKVAVTSLTPVQANWIRTAIPGLVWLVVVSYLWRSSVARGHPPRRLVPIGVAFAAATAVLTDVLEWTMRLTALQLAPLAVIYPLSGTIPLFAAFFAYLLLHEPLAPRQLAGIGLLVIGVGLVAALGTA